MTSLHDVESGLCQGQKCIDLSCGLTEFPQSLFQYVNDLEILNLSGNKLSTLPDNFAEFKKLRILFLSENEFSVFPEILGSCPSLTMIGFKSCRIQSIGENTLPKALRWLILTDNKLKALPQSINTCSQLQKLMLAGNRLTSLPENLAECTNLELLRISANQLTEIPSWLFKMPKLSWLAFAGNPCLKAESTTSKDLAAVAWDSLDIKHELGTGASGIISQAAWQRGSDIAVKIFKGQVTSDGFPEDEKNAAMHAGTHEHLVEVIGQVTAHPEQKEGLLLSLIPDIYRNLANPPSLDSCTRDIYHEATYFHINQVLEVVLAIVSVANHLHEKHINHGDLYAHNILINHEAHCLLGDFGAASIYSVLAPELHQDVERIEVRAWGCLLEELLALTHPTQNKEEAELFNQLQALESLCLQENTKQRPLFSDIEKQLKQLTALGALS